MRWRVVDIEPGYSNTLTQLQAAAAAAHIGRPSIAPGTAWPNRSVSIECSMRLQGPWDGGACRITQRLYRGWARFTSSGTSRHVWGYYEDGRRRMVNACDWTSKTYMVIETVVDSGLAVGMACSARLASVIERVRRSVASQHHVSTLHTVWPCSREWDEKLKWKCHCGNKLRGIKKQSNTWRETENSAYLKHHPIKQPASVAIANANGTCLVFYDTTYHLLPTWLCTVK